MMASLSLLDMVLDGMALIGAVITEIGLDGSESAVYAPGIFPSVIRCQLRNNCEIDGADQTARLAGTTVKPVLIYR